MEQNKQEPCCCTETTRCQCKFRSICEQHDKNRSTADRRGNINLRYVTYLIYNLHTYLFFLHIYLVTAHFPSPLRPMRCSIQPRCTLAYFTLSASSVLVCLLNLFVFISLNQNCDCHKVYYSTLFLDCSYDRIVVGNK